MYPILGAAGVYVAYRAYMTKQDKTNRAAETYDTKIDQKQLGKLEPAVTRPVSMPSRAYVGTALSINPGTYHPVSDTNEMDAEKAVKVLNIANKFLYG